jgi:hypothetical protein
MAPGFLYLNKDQIAFVCYSLTSASSPRLRSGLERVMGIEPT